MGWLYLGCLGNDKLPIGVAKLPPEGSKTVGISKRFTEQWVDNLFSTNVGKMFTKLKGVTPSRHTQYLVLSIFDYFQLLSVACYLGVVSVLNKYKWRYTFHYGTQVPYTTVIQLFGGNFSWCT